MYVCVYDDNGDNDDSDESSSSSSSYDQQQMKNISACRLQQRCIATEIYLSPVATTRRDQHDGCQANGPASSASRCTAVDKACALALNFVVRAQACRQHRGRWCECMQYRSFFRSRSCGKAQAPTRQ